MAGSARAEQAASEASVKAKTAAKTTEERRDAEPAWEAERAMRRSGFVVGASFGSGVVSIAGFPNDVKKVGRESFYTETGATLGGFGTLWFGGALTDWFIFGLGLGGGSLPFLSDRTATAGGIVFHVEAFPLFPRGGRWRDVGVMLDAGTGAVTVEDDARSCSSTAAPPR